MSERTEDRGLAESLEPVIELSQTLQALFLNVFHWGTHPVTMTRGLFSWLRLMETVRPRPPLVLGGKDTSATMWGLLAGEEADFADTTP